MSSPIQYCTVSEETASKRSDYQLVGTEEQIAEEAKRLVEMKLRHRSGSITFTPIHPINIVRLGDDT